MSSEPTPPAAQPQPSPDRKPEMKSMFQSSLADSLGLTVTQKPAAAAKPQTPPKPEKSEKQSSFFVADAAPSVLAPTASVRGSEPPSLPRSNPRTHVIEGDGLRAKQGIDMPRLPVSFRPREGWSDVAGRNLGKDSGFRNTRMAAHEMEAAQIKAWADHNRKQLEDRKRGPGSG